MAGGYSSGIPLALPTPGQPLGAPVRGDDPIDRAVMRRPALERHNGDPALSCIPHPPCLLLLRWDESGLAVRQVVTRCADRVVRKITVTFLDVQGSQAPAQANLPAVRTEPAKRHVHRTGTSRVRAALPSARSPTARRAVPAHDHPSSREMPVRMNLFGPGHVAWPARNAGGIRCPDRGKIEARNRQVRGKKPGTAARHRRFTAAVVHRATGVRRRQLDARRNR